MKRTYEDGKITVTTDNKWHNFLYRNEVPRKVFKKEFDWMNERGDDYQDGFFKYRDWWYHFAEFIAFTKEKGIEGRDLKYMNQEWDAYKSDSYFSGTVIKVSKDGEQYKVGTYMS